MQVAEKKAEKNLQKVMNEMNQQKKAIDTEIEATKSSVEKVMSNCNCN